MRRSAKFFGACGGQLDQILTNRRPAARTSTRSAGSLPTDTRNFYCDARERSLKNFSAPAADCLILCTHNLAFLACTRLDRLDRTAFILRKSIEANAYATARRHANTSHFFVLPRQIQNFRRLRRAEPDPHFIDKLAGAQRGIARAGGVFCAGNLRQGGVFSTQSPIQHTSPHQKSCRLRRQTPPPTRAQNRHLAAGG